MLRTLITKKNACHLVTLLALLAALLTIWPMRVYKENHVFQGRGEIQRVSKPVDVDNDAGEYFTAQYAHLEQLGVWIDSYEEGTGLKFQLFDTEDGVNNLKAEEHLQVDPSQLPGYVMIPVDVDLTPGESYVYLVRGEDSVFRVGFESEQVSADATAPVYDLGFYHDTSINGLATATKLVYRMPIEKKASLGLGLVYLAAAVATWLLFGLYYRVRPGRNGLTTLERVLQYCGTPLVLGYGSFFLACIWLQRFDERLSDNLVYSAGVILTVLILLFGLWHDRTGLPDLINGEKLGMNWRHYAISADLAVILICSTVYMNAVTENIHTAMERWILALLCVMALLMGGGQTQRRRQRAKPVWWLCVPVGLLAVLMLVFRNGRTWVLLMIGVYVLLFLRFVFWQERSRWLEDLCRGIVLHFLIAAADSMLHRYYFAFVYSRFNMEFHTVTVTSYYLLIVGAAVLTLFTEKFSRTYAEAVRLQRNSAENGAAAELVSGDSGAEGFTRREQLPGSFLWYADRLWKEAVLLGMTGSYMLMTLSRAGIFELALFYLLAVVLVYLTRKRQERQQKRGTTDSGKSTQAGAEDTRKGEHTGAGRMLAWMVLATVVLLPAVFTNQRLVSTVVGEPRWHEEVEPYPDAVVRHPQWNSKWFMSAEIFVRDFADRVIGGEIGTKIYFRYHWDVHQDVKATANDQYVTGALDPAQEFRGMDGLRPLVMLAMNAESLAGTDGTAAVGEEITSLDQGDYSNGRLGVWSAYLHQLNWTGHDTMGAVLPGGAVAVHAHNNILQTAFDYGLPAGALFLVCLVVTLIAAGIYYTRFAAGGQAGCSLLLLLIVLGYSITGMVEWTFTLCNPFCLVFLLCLAPLLFRDR